MDIVERLRRINAFLHVTEDEPEYDYKLSYEAADEIERMRNKVRWLEMCENTVVKQTNEIEKLRETNIMQARWLYEAQQENKLFKEKVRQWLDIGKPAAMEGE